MADVQNVSAPAPAAASVVEQNTISDAAPASAVAVNDTVAADATDVNASSQSESAVAALDANETTLDALPAVDPTAGKPVEPISEGQLLYKGPGLVKSLIPSKKTFWLSEDPVSSQLLDLYLRGEKPEIANPVVAWASQTGRGLLFISKKHETDRTHPADVLALFDATDLKKHSPHEFSFKLNGNTHTFRAGSDAERDGWYLSIETAMELGKGSKDEIRETESYRTELEKLNKHAFGGAMLKRSQSQPKKSMDLDKAGAERTDSYSGDEEDVTGKKKRRSTSRGVFNRLIGKKDETEHKAADKEVDKDDVRPDEDASVAQNTETVPLAVAAASADTPATADAAEAKPVEDTAAVVEEKPKVSKRGSIFGRVQSTWSGLRSPAKEKEQKEVELKPETPAKDGPVSDHPPVLPETATTDLVAEASVPVVEEPVAEPNTVATKEDVTTPNKERSNFLLGLAFIKRNRSASPSTNPTQEAKEEHTPAAGENAESAVKPAELPAEATSPVVDKAEEPKTDSFTPNKRHSMLGSLGRRASKALTRMQAPKRENTAPAATEVKKEDAPEAKPTEENVSAENQGESKTRDAAEPQQQSIGDVVPDAVNVGQPQPQHSTPAVTASA